MITPEEAEAEAVARLAKAVDTASFESMQAYGTAVQAFAMARIAQTLGGEGYVAIRKVKTDMVMGEICQIKGVDHRGWPK